MLKYAKLIALTVMACAVGCISLLIDPLLNIFSAQYFQPPLGFVEGFTVAYSEAHGDFSRRAFLPNANGLRSNQAIRSLYDDAYRPEAGIHLNHRQHMTFLLIFKLNIGLIAICTGIVWIKRRHVPIVNEGEEKELYAVTGWDAIGFGCAVIVFGVAFLADACGIFTWIGL